MALMKVITAIVSYATVMAIYKIIPLALLIPSPVQLEKEINERKAAQDKLQSRLERSLVTSQVTREIRSNLQLKAICDTTAERCATLFNADHCVLYRCTLNHLQDDGEGDDGEVQREHEYLVLSEHSHTDQTAREHDDQHPPLHLLPGYVHSSASSNIH